jgi:predicted PurR-regulated permease PerM
MKLVKLDKSQQKVLMVFAYVAIVIGVIFLRPYLMLIVFSAIMAVLFSPVYVRYINKGKGPGAASFYTFMISMAVIIIPVIFICIICFYQISSLVDTLAQGDYGQQLTDTGNGVVDAVNRLYETFGIDKTLTIQELGNDLAVAAEEIGKQLFNDVIATFASLFSLITAAIIYIYVFMSMLKNNNKIIDTIRKFNPLGDEVTDLYLDRSGAMTKATVRGQFIIAFMQGAESAAVLALVGFEQLFFFFLVFLTFMSLIPLGAGIITIPIGIVMILTGNVTGGVIVIANHLLIATNVDNVMRPKLVPKTARLDPALMILAVFSGLALFGFLGIVIGPIIMILIVTTFQIFNEVFYKEESIDRSKLEKGKSKISSMTKKVTEVFNK